MKLQDNKVTITNGTSTVVMDSGNVTITATSVTVTSPTVSFSGVVNITGGLTVQGKNLGANHTHSGVANGSGNTGGVN